MRGSAEGWREMERRHLCMALASCAGRGCKIAGSSGVVRG